MTMQITLDSEQVLGIASQLENDNIELNRLLTESKTTLEKLASVWTGKAAEDTRSAYESFANKFFQSYKDIIDQYVKFLRTNVAAGYEQTEAVNAQLSDSFR